MESALAKIDVEQWLCICQKRDSGIIKICYTASHFDLGLKSVEFAQDLFSFFIQHC